MIEVLFLQREGLGADVCLDFLSFWSLCFTHSFAFHYVMPFKIYVSKYVIDVLHSLGITCKSEDVMPGKWHVHCFGECIRFRSLTFPYWSCVHARWQWSPSQMPVKPSCFHYFFVFIININRVIVKMGTVERKCPPQTATMNSAHLRSWIPSGLFMSGCSTNTFLTKPGNDLLMHHLHSL